MWVKRHGDTNRSCSKGPTKTSGGCDVRLDPKELIGWGRTLDW